jgi:hypothetical protein
MELGMTKKSFSAEQILTVLRQIRSFDRLGKSARLRAGMQLFRK